MSDINKISSIFNAKIDSARTMEELKHQNRVFWKEWPDNSAV